MRTKIKIIDGNNQFLINYAKATSYQDLVRRCQQLNFGADFVYWTFDGMDSRAQRRALYPDYKNTASRAKNKQDPTKYELLRQFKNEDLPNLGGVYIIEKAGVEADDIIRSLVRLVAGPNIDIEIVSNDGDLVDLTALGGVTQPQGKMAPCCTCPTEIPLYKTLVGDTGDNIKGLKGFGDKAWEKLTAAERVCIQTNLDENTADFSYFADFDVKLAKKLTENWEQVKLWYKIVSPMWVSNEDLLKNLREYPRKITPGMSRMSMD